MGAAPTSLSRLSHCCWCCSDSGKAAMRSYLEERNIFHWAKSRWSRRMFELCYTQERLDQIFRVLITISKLILLLPGWYLFCQSTPCWSLACIYCLGLISDCVAPYRWGMLDTGSVVSRPEVAHHSHTIPSKKPLVSLILPCLCMVCGKNLERNSRTETISINSVQGGCFVDPNVTKPISKTPLWLSGHISQMRWNFQLSL